jgi:hypothetical protein
MTGEAWVGAGMGAPGGTSTLARFCRREGSVSEGRKVVGSEEDGVVGEG